MKRTQKEASLASRARYEAGILLSRQGNRMKMILASLIVLSVAVVYILLDSVYSVIRVDLVRSASGLMASDHTGMIFLWIADCVYAILLVALSELLTVPLFCGLLYMAYELSEGRRVVLSDVFHAFSSGQRYADALTVSARFCSTFLLWYLICQLTYSAVRELSLGSEWGIWVGVAAIVIEIVIALILLSRHFGYTYALYTEDSVIGDMWLEKANRPYFRGAFCHYWLGWLAWLLLSVATLGILFVADTLLRMLISYFRLCEATKERLLSDRRK